MICSWPLCNKEAVVTGNFVDARHANKIGFCEEHKPKFETPTQTELLIIHSQIREPYEYPAELLKLAEDVLKAPPSKETDEEWANRMAKEITKDFLGAK